MAVVSTVDNIQNFLPKTEEESKTNRAQAALTKDLASFLRMLTVQLQNQDPTQPLDTNEFTQQIAVLSQVEQGINTNKNLEQLITLFSANALNATVGYIGKRVEAEGDVSILQNGGAMFAYDLASGAAVAEVEIKDVLGNIVFRGPGTTFSGRNEVFWNGANSTTGLQAGDGAYVYTVTARDAAGNPVAVTTYTTGQVTAVNIKDGEPSLLLGPGYALPFGKVLRVGADPLANAVVPPPANEQPENT